jgi:hypothetical protein
LTAVFPISWSAYAHSMQCAERLFKGTLSKARARFDRL